MNVILIGSGGTTLELLRRLGEIWNITVVETSKEQMENARTVRPFRELLGDGSSRLVLQRAGLERADALVAATNDDEANLEACRLAKEAGIVRIVAVANEPTRLPAYQEQGIPAVSPDSLTARRIELALESRRVSSTSFADGKAEAIEFRIADDSPVRGKALRELHPGSWIVGVILRDDRLIVPHGDTTLEEGDLVTVVGSGADFPGIVQTFTSGEARFPLDYGKRAAVMVEEEADLSGSLAEAVYLVRNSRASSLLLVHRDPDGLRDKEAGDRIRKLLGRAGRSAAGVEVRRRAVGEAPSRALTRLPQEESVGVVVLRVPRGRSLIPWLRSRKLIARLQRARAPILLARGTHPYAKILIPASRTRLGKAAARAAIDLARSSGARITGLAVVEPAFLSAGETLPEARLATDWLKEQAAVQGVTVEGKIRRGNPVRAFVEEGAGADLLILGVGQRAARFLDMDVPGHILRRTGSSVLLVPALG